VEFLLLPERVRLRSTGDDDARDDRLFEEFVEVEGDLLRPSAFAGNVSIFRNWDDLSRSKLNSCQLGVTSDTRLAYRKIETATLVGTSKSPVGRY